MQELLGLALEQPPGGDAGPRRDDVGDVVAAHLVLDHDVATHGHRFIAGRLLQLPFHRRDLAVEDRRRAAEVALTLEPLGLASAARRAGLQVADPVEPGLLGLPPRVERVELLLPVGEVLLQAGQPLARGLVGLGLEVQLLHLQPVDLTPELVDLHRRRVDLHPQPGRGLVDEVDRLVGQLAPGDVAVRQRRRRHERRVGDGHLVVRLVPLLEPAKDRDGVLDRRLADEDLLEPPLQGGVLLDVLAVLVQRRRADQPELASGQHRLEHVAGVHRPLAGRAGADDGMQLVDEGDDLALRAGDLLENGLEPLLELAAVLRAGHHRAEVERRPATCRAGSPGRRRRRCAEPVPRRPRSCRRRGRR